MGLVERPGSIESGDVPRCFFLGGIEGNNIVRILYFFDKDKIIIATNGFIKKQKKTPPGEIELAKRRRADYYARKEAGTYE